MRWINDGDKTSDGLHCKRHGLVPSYTSPFSRMLRLATWLIFIVIIVCILAMATR